MGQKVHPLIFRSKVFPRYINLFDNFYAFSKKTSYYFSFFNFITKYNLKEILYVQSKQYSSNYYLFNVVFYSKESFYKNNIKQLIPIFLKNINKFYKVCINFVVLKHPLISTTFLLKYISEKINSTKVSLRKFIPKLALLVQNMYKIKGFKCLVSGRINGVQMAKIETFKFNESSVQHITSYVKYNSIHVPTKYGILGIKIWLFL